MSADDADRYRKQADMCREQAILRSGDPSTRDVWLRLAPEYDRLAGDVKHMASQGEQSVSRQPMQQQQTKARS